MPQPTLAYVAPADAPYLKRWMLLSPFARIALFAVAWIVFAYGGVHAAALLGLIGKDATPLQDAFTFVLAELVPTLIAYLCLVSWVEKRVPSELTRRAVPGVLAGLGAGVVFFSAVIGVLWIVGSYHVTGTNAHAPWVYEFILYGVCAGVAEEIMFRGVLFRICEEGLGTWFAVVFSSLAFGAIHLGNSGATWWNAAQIAILAGVPLALLYHLTRSLWPCVGWHAGWNVAQGTLYGIPVSGNAADGFLVSKMTGPDWLTGGAFGVEGSLVAPLVCSLGTIALLVIAIRRGTIVSPFWRRRPPIGAMAPTAAVDG
jgi:membrane protease YdiL (CAAX protease family)